MSSKRPNSVYVILYLISILEHFLKSHEIDVSPASLNIYIFFSLQDINDFLFTLGPLQRKRGDLWIQ